MFTTALVDTQTHVWNNMHTGLITNNELICECAGTGVSVFVVGGWEGQGRAGQVCGLVSFFQNKGVT